MHKPIVALVVEDEVLVRISIADDLQDRGFIVSEAGTAAEAIAILVELLEITVLVTDIDMPGGTAGLILAAAVRDRWPPMKIIVTSGHHQVAIGDLPEGNHFFGTPCSADAVASATGNCQWHCRLR